jgi:diguanylate cyclase (GGDEF)-like protein/PAS domain S-box-containing protein
LSLLNFPLKYRILIAISAYVLWVLGFAYSNYNHERNRIYNQLDQQLESAALTASLLLSDRLHHQNMMADDISIQDDKQNISTLSAYTDNSDIAYIYTLILRDNKIFFTSSSATKKERESREGLSHYFEHYHDVDPRVFDVFKTKQKAFLEYRDQWGSFRSIFMPRSSSDGTFYVTVADIPTNHVQALLNQQLYRTLAIALLFLVFAYPLYFVANHYIRDKSNDLEQKLHQKTKDLAQNQQRLEYALRAAKQAWFEVNIPTGEIHVSKEYVALVGREVLNNHQESTIDNWKNNIHPDDRDATIEKFQQGLEQDEPSSVEFRRKRADGSWVWIYSTGQVIERDKQGNPITLVGINMDITDRKRNEQVLQTLAESAGTTNGDIFKTIVRHLALSHDMRYALIAKINDDATQATTLAFWKDGKLVENFSYQLAGTPCETVLDDAGMAFYSDNIQHLFPNDQMLVEMQAESYIGVALRNSNNKVIGLISVINDRPIKKTSQTHTLMQSLAVRTSFELERRENDEKLQLFSYLFRDSREGMFLVDSNDIITEVNPAFCKYTGYSKDELLGQAAQIFRSKSHKYPPEFYINIRQKVIENGIWQGEVWNKLKNNDEILAAVTVTQITDENNKPTHNFIMVSDITEKKRQQDALKFMAHYDSLTKLPNRTLFVDRFNQAVAHSKRSDTLLAICFLDIDNFKPVNDNFGHEVGDQLLIEVSQRISANLREEDTVSRQGGDEFTLLIGSIESFEQCEQMLKRILQSIAEPYRIDDTSHTISASIGVTLYPLDNSDVDTLTRHADHAMYQAKQSGKNQYHLFDALDDQQKSIRRHQQQEINNAIQYNQFCLYYQPKVNMKTGKVYGV